MPAIFAKNARSLMLCFLVVGIVLFVLFLYASWHPDAIWSTPTVDAWFFYMISVPFVLYLTKGERVLRLVVLCFWLCYLAFFAFGAYKMHIEP